MIIPWRVDVPEDRWPIINWLIIVVILGVFALQIAIFMEQLERGGQVTHERSEPNQVEQKYADGGGISLFVLKDVTFTGLFGYM